MCGLVGFYQHPEMAFDANLIKRMTDTIKHRGPDGEGYCFANTATHVIQLHRSIENANLAFGHRRLAIVDLSPGGAQPMLNQDADKVIIYNGELYNHLELRKILSTFGVTFNSRSDTETLLKAYEIWGGDCVKHFNGMFSFAIWDAQRQQLFLARDRFGVKPLYYYVSDKLFIFASEIKAILTHPKVSREICYPALNEYFTFQNVLGDLTLFNNIRILPAGHTLTLDLSDASLPLTKICQTKQYWDFYFPTQSQRLNISFEDAQIELRRLFAQAVERQLMSDVPVGSYLSGGMDSGSIVAVASQKLKRIHTFTGGFDLSSASGLEMGFDERPASEALANLFKTEHYENVLHAGDMEHVMPELIWHLEDLRVGQCYPNYYTARLASKFVKVCLSGTGGDELFGGYPWRYYRGLEAGDYYSNYYQFWQRLVSYEDKLDLFNTDTKRNIGSHSAFVAFQTVLNGFGRVPETVEDRIHAALYFEAKTFLHGLFIVEDKMSMAHSLESRVPFLDNDLVDFALQLPASYKLQHLDQTAQTLMKENEIGKRQRYDQCYGDGKWVLRETMRQWVPPDTITRAKQGFSAPDASWFRGESLDYIQRLLQSKSARIYELLQPAFVQQTIEAHCHGVENKRLLLWSFISLEWWLKLLLF